MARTLKNFNTEEEYEEWVNSPYMRAPYTCLVKETGNVHYFDGDDEDNSVTIVVKKTGWMRLGTISIMKLIDHIEINGTTVDKNTMAHEGETSYYYRKDVGVYEKENYVTSVLQVHNKDRGGLDMKGALMNYYPRRFGREHRNRVRPVKRFLYVKKDDIVKIIFKKTTHYCGGGRTESIFFGKNITPKMRSINKFAKEIVLGNGFKLGIVNGINFIGVKRVIIGKNVKSIDVFNTGFGRYGIYRIFVYKNTKVINDDMVEGKIIRI